MISFIASLLKEKPALLRFDKFGIILEINTLVTSFFGYSEKELLGLNINTLASINFDIDEQDFKPFKQNVLCKNGDIHLCFFHLSKRKDVFEIEFCSLEQLKQEKYVSKILEGILIRRTGVKLLDDITREISLITEMEFVFINKYEENEMGRMLHFSKNGALMDYFNFSLKGTPCELTKLTGSYLCSENLQDKFSEVENLKSLKPQSYIGLALEDSNSKKIGSIMALSSRKVTNSKYILKILKIVSSRVAAELEREILVDELKKAREEADYKNKAKGEFLATMSHEIRTPLTGILGSIRVLDDLCKESEQKEWLNILSQSSSSLMTIVNDILDHSKIEENKITLEHMAVDLIQLVKHSIFLFKEKISNKNVSIDLIGDKNDFSYYCDPTRIGQIIQNILSNAVKFTEKGSIKLELKKMIIKDKPFVELTIEDTGIGMTSDQLKKIFLSYQQADENTFRKYGGTGLGMPISKKLTELMNGKIHVTSQKGEGTSFTLNFPFEACDSSEIIHRNDKKSVARNYAKRALLAEDNPINVKIFSKTLTDLGIEVVVAENGQKLLDMIDEDHDIIFMDNKMPIMDGKETTRLLRKRGYEKPIIAFSADLIEFQNKEDCLKLGFNSFLPKPLKMEKVIQELDFYFKN